MWFSFARKNRRNQPSRSRPNTFRPRLEALEDRCLLSAGALDPTFGNGGLVSGPLIGPIVLGGVSFFDSGAFAVVVQTDGKIVAGGGSSNTSRGTNWALERFNANGTLDSSFGTGGVVQTVIGAGQSTTLALALQSDGKIVAVGSAWHSSTVGELAVARYNSNGSLDTTFGSRGIVQIWTSNANYFANAVAIQADGKIDVAGGGFGLARFNANGSLDNTFGSRRNPGIVAAPAFAGPNGLAIQSNGEIIVVGSTGSAMAVARYTTTGQLDSSFGSSGTVTMAPAGSTAAAQRVLIQSNGDIVASGYSGAGTSTVATLARLTSTGQLDTTFGGSNTGFAINSSIMFGRSITQEPNGDLVAAGTAPPGANFGVAAFLPSGVPDTTFGTGGTTTADFAGGGVNVYGMAIQGDGKIVAAGDGWMLPDTNNSFFGLARFLPPDTKIGSFTGSSTGGYVTLTASNIMNSNPTTTISQVNFYLQNPDLSLTLLGTGTNNSGTWTFTFAESTAGLISGNMYTFVAQAVDSAGIFSDPVTVSLTVS